MHKRLKWNAIGLEPKTQLLLELITKEKENLPTDHLQNYKKFQRFIDELTHILTVINQIRIQLIPRLEKLFRLSFQTPELLMLAFSRSSIRNIYENLQLFFEGKQISSLKQREFAELASSGDAADVLALIGDSVLDLAVIQSLWDSSMATTGDLTKKRSDVVSNENLAKFSDKLNLFNYRLTRLNDPSEQLAKEKTTQHEKGTLVEALLGVIYLEFGFDELIRIIPLLQ